MKYIEVETEQAIPAFATELNKGAPVFVLFHMDGCGHCIAMRPEWQKLRTVGQSLGAPVVIAEVNQKLLTPLSNKLSNSKIKNNIANISGFPSIKYIKGDTIVDYDGDRTIDRFMKWIRSRSTIKGGRRGRRSRSRRRRSKSRQRSTFRRRR